jgi:hypothetical protein
MSLLITLIDEISAAEIADADLKVGPMLLPHKLKLHTMLV